MLFDSVANVLRRKFTSAERALYFRHLIEGGPKDSTQGGQRHLAEAMKTTFDVKDWKLSPAVVKHLAKQCRAEAGDTGRKVPEYLEQIRIAEQLLAPCVSCAG